jgi:Glycogen recognition site of AMP-activated protein kinase
MGNQQNSSNPDRRKEKKEVAIDTKNPDTKSFYAMTSKETNSSYKGVKTSGENSANELEKDVKAELTTECQTIPENIDDKDIKIPTTFEWKEGGNIVYITGTFSNWSQWFMMTKTLKIIKF